MNKRICGIKPAMFYRIEEHSVTHCRAKIYGFVQSPCAISHTRLDLLGPKTFLFPWKMCNAADKV